MEALPNGRAPTPPPPSDVLEFFGELLDRESKERQADRDRASLERERQTEAFTKSIAGLRTELRVLVLAAIVILGSLAGANIAFTHGGISASPAGYPVAIAPVPPTPAPTPAP